MFNIFNVFVKEKLINYIPLLNNEKRLYWVIIIFTLLVSVLFSNCLPYINKDKLDYPQYKFARIINKKENATLLNYGFLDGGFYFASRLQPVNKYYHIVNISIDALPEMYDEQLNIIINKQVDFIVARLTKKQSVTDIKCPELYENYEIISYADDLNDKYRFILFEKK